MKQQLIYLDNSATSYPKPEPVYQTVEDAMRNVGGNPGRSGHRMSIAANKVIFNTREALARLFGISDSSRIIFTSNATESLNLAIKGYVKAGDHIITSSMEHNSVTRPLRALEKIGVEVTKIPCRGSYAIDTEEVRKAIRRNTALIVMTHASNVIGMVENVSEIGNIARKNGLTFLLDASQTAGTVPIDVEKLKVDLMAAPGHKGLLGPQGTGILYVAPHVDLTPLKEGGTGSGLSTDEQPEALPDKYEAGTMNTPGIAGLGAGIKFILEEGIDKIRDKEEALIKRLMYGLNKIERVTIYGPEDISKRVSLVSFNIRNIEPSVVAFNLDELYEIMSRSGLHCSPDAHRFLGTYPSGSVRFSPGYFNTTEDIDAAIDAVREIAGGS